MLRPGVVEMRGSMIIRLRPAMHDKDYTPPIADTGQRRLHGRIAVDVKSRITGHTKVFLTWLSCSRFIYR